MDARKVTRPDPGGVPALNESRSHVLAALQEAARPLSAGEVAKRVRLHANTARFHLDALVEGGLAERNVEDREQPGRPRILYTARPGSAHTGRRSYRLLAEILAGSLAAETPQPAQAALRAGRAWGRYLADRPPPFRRLDADSATRQLVRMLDDIGFAPESTDDGRKVLLHHCPFRETAEEHQEVVCSIHLGLIQGLLAELGAPVEAERLDPFVEPGLCIAHLSPTTSPES
ncbi:helix-turn-helix domain-containing protein [Sphaerimonospora mesophila]|uniref:helix-turn-helix transcriptional regulator n=1 Tax=Sphaerimonospora mesophila TaxID=37483 RepID=UPI0006E2ACF9